MKRSITSAVCVLFVIGFFFGRRAYIWLKDFFAGNYDR